MPTRDEEISELEEFLKEHTALATYDDPSVAASIARRVIDYGWHRTPF